MYQTRLKELREREGITGTHLATLLGIKKSQYSLYENEHVTMPIKHLNTLCNYFHVSLDYIFSFTDTKIYSSYLPNIDKQKAKLILKTFRKSHNLTQTKLAKLLNTTFTTISSYERGINIISTNYLYEISSKYNISADYLLGKTPTNNLTKKRIYQKS